MSFRLDQKGRILELIISRPLREILCRRHLIELTTSAFLNLAAANRFYAVLPVRWTGTGVFGSFAGIAYDASPQCYVEP